MDNNLMIFESNEFGKLTITSKNDDIWFVAKEIADILGYEKSGKMYSRLDEDEKKETTLQFGASWQKAIIINESGFYNAILGSKKPEAKAEIGHRREATAMQTASIKSKENEKLKEQIGDSKNYKQVKAIQWLSDVFDITNKGTYSQIGRQLVKITRKLGYEYKEIEHTKYGHVKAYHIDVINHFRLKLKEDLNMLRNYRID